LYSGRTHYFGKCVFILRYRSGKGNDYNNRGPLLVVTVGIKKYGGGESFNGIFFTSEFSLDFLETDRLSRNVGAELPLNAA
jgi:hypothetical protein